MIPGRAGIGRRYPARPAWPLRAPSLATWQSVVSNRQAQSDRERSEFGARRRPGSSDWPLAARSDRMTTQWTGRALNRAPRVEQYYGTVPPPGRCQ
eukprot:749022-Hanusia_phi.AAC.1